jgi:serine/threonine-protein kinase
MSPEQLSQPSLADHHTDIWSLGVVLYELVSGHAPFAASSFAETCARILQSEPRSLAELDATLPPALCSAIARCLRKQAPQRFPSVLALAEALVPFGSERARASLSAISAISAGESRRVVPEREAPRQASSASATPTATRGPQGTGTLTAAAHSSPPPRAPSTYRVAGALVGSGAVLAVWLVARLLASPSTQPAQLTSAAAAPSAMIAALQASAAAPEPSASAALPGAATSAASHAGLAPATFTAHPRDKRVIAALAPAGPQALPSATPTPKASVDSVFGERR